MMESVSLRILILGRGRMGREVQAAAEARGHQVVGMWGRDDLLRGEWPEADVAIDFTAPDAAVEVFAACRLQSLPLVSGTTGWLSHWDDVEREVIRLNHAMVWAPNFSKGVFLFRKAMRTVQAVMAGHGYPLHLEEVHHIGKVDAPSGTALSLVDDLRDGDAAEVPVRAGRIPGVPGTHSVVWEGEGDRISLEHAAKNRSGFATGAVQCAEWLVRQTPPFDKIYSIEEVWG